MSATGTDSPHAATAMLTHSCSNSHHHGPAPSRRTVTHPQSPSSPRSKKYLRRRALRACLSCRARKVRCDVVQRAPCGNCKWDNIECVVASRRNAKFYQENKPATLPRDNPVELSREVDTEETKLSVQGLRNYTMSDDPTPVQSIPVTYEEETTDLSSTEEDMLGILAASLSDQSPAYLPNTPIQEIIKDPPSAASSVSKLLDIPHFMHLPGFIKPLATRIAIDDLAFLHSRQALTLPSLDCQDALLWSFFEYVYPFMPILDLDLFLQVVSNQDGKAGQVSLLLFQAVLFAGTAHVKLEYLRNAGFTTRKQAGKAFFQRVRFLYDFNTESDHLVLVQALLLMSLWYESPENHRNTWNWIDVSISQAFAAGLHQDPSNSKSPDPPRVQHLRRRIWWTCFMRDRVVSLGMRRPPRIRDDDYNVLMLEDSDFEPASWQPGVQTLRRAICSYTDNTEKRSELASLCIAKASLCRCWQDHVRTHYTIFSENAGNGGTEIYRVPRTNDKESFAACNENLLRWQSALPERCKYLPLKCDPSTPGNTSVSLNRTILHMTYFAAVASLHRSRFTALLHDPGASLFDQELSKLCMQNAAMQISTMAFEIHEAGVDMFMPALGITLLVSAAVVHLLEVKGVIQADKERAYQGYRRCMSVIESLKDMFVVADLAKDAMEWAFVEPLDGDQSPSNQTNSVSSLCKSLVIEKVDSRGIVMSLGDCSPSDTASTNLPPIEGPPVERCPWDGDTAVKQIHTLPDGAITNEWSEFDMGDLEGFESCILFNGIES
ncbi:fungal-specific transcription factor domain-containing protein [Ilyonectria destructans]|nr:fungal-specific transcription factor domain-containing protein [Ilyonectria destructans]